jgi:PAS domain S-box-containing protein
MKTKKASILIVEDEPVVRLHLKSCLEQLGYAVLPPVSSYKGALKSFKEDEPNLVLMDIVLEGEYDGIHAAEEIAQEFKVPVIFLTAYSDEKTIKRARVCQPFGYIVKPFREEDLKSSIEIALFKHQQEKLLRDRLSFNSYLLDSIEYPVVALDCNENIIFINPKIQQLLGKKDDQVFGKGFEDVFKIFSENGDRMEIPFDRILVKGEAEEFNGISLKISKEKNLLVDIMVSPFKQTTNKTIGSVLTIRDVTAYSMSREEKEAVLETLIKLMEEPPEYD